jgi:trehalose 6-phosphate phosphatase
MTDAVAALIAEPRSALIAIDFDGTLAPIVERPEDALPAEGALHVLISLSRRVGQLAVISGRAADEVVALGGLERVPGIVVLGHYGMQRWSAGELESPPPDPRVDAARERLPAVLAAAPAGVYVEDKRHSVAVHTRPAADPAAALAALAPALSELAAEVGLEALPGRFVVELRPPGVDKASALRSLLSAGGRSTVIYIGDDVGDLPALRLVAELRDAGAINGLAVVVTSAGAEGAAVEVPSQLADSADLLLPGPDGVVAWLAGIDALLTD